MNPKKKYVVLGGAGAMGQITVKDLVAFKEPHDEIIIADYSRDKAETFAQSFKDPHVQSLYVDVRDKDSTIQALSDTFVLINSVQYQLNLEVMEIALTLKCHYIDIGGLFHTTRKQLELHDRFKAIHKIALLGMGAAPGITNILSRYAADQLDQVTEIHTRVASHDQSTYRSLPALPVSYSLQTILEEFSYEPAVFSKGKFKFVNSMSGDLPMSFPKPLGVKRPMYTLHSEVATLPLSFAQKGVKEVSFKIAFDQDFTRKVKFLRDLGLASHDQLNIHGVHVKPIEVVNRVAMSQKPPVRKGPLRQYEIIRAIVMGKKKKEKITYTVDCHTLGMPKWNVGTDINTGSPPAIAARMLARGDIHGSGTLPPEVCVPPELFFKELKKRNMTIQTSVAKNWKKNI